MDRSRGNFMSKFTDLNSRALKHLTSQQFFEVWNNYDQDGEFKRYLLTSFRSLVIMNLLFNHLNDYCIVGNGYIEGGELENFLREFVSSISDEEVS